MTVYRMLCVLVLAGALASVLVACGQRGPLYLPEDARPPATSQDGGIEPEAEPEMEGEEEPQNEDEVHSGSFEGGRPH